jgi:UDP-3-O-[3-hydroxymyristoyl] N-acetylglucosamine deacetylase
MRQATLRDAVHLRGIGLHTGESVSARVLPAPVDFGVQFVRDGTRIPALADRVVDTSRATVLGIDGVTVSTVEHLLSALLGMGVSNAEIVVEGPEIPVADGSAQTFCDAIAGAGIAEQNASRAAFAPAVPFAHRAKDRAIVFLPSDAFRVRFVADFPAPVGVQYLDARVDAGWYREEIAPARTFGYLREVEALRARGLARGGSLDNALVFGDDGPMQRLRWPDEVVRHKVLDLLGDLALLGAWPQCDVIAIKSGHALHVEAMQMLRAQAMAATYG